MKIQATVMLTLQARTLEAAGAVLDDVLDRANSRDDVAVGRIEIVTPPGDGIVTLPPTQASAGTLRPNSPWPGVAAGGETAGQPQPRAAARGAT